ncbi:MAG: putative metal-binding motif-containing protein [Sandaracinaceae bacterium]
MKARVGALSSTALLLVLGSCTSPVTQLVVAVDTPMAIPGELDAIEIVVAGPSGIQTSSTEDLTAADAPTLPLTLGVTPATEALGPLNIIAIGRRSGIEVVRTAARVTLTEGETRLLTLTLVLGCAGRPCDAGETCGPGGCTPLERGALPAFTGEVPRYRMEDACDALPWDEDGDGEASEMCGGLDCADQDPTRGPGVPEQCDNIDNDCDGEVDPDCECAPDGVSEGCTTECGSTSERFCAAGVFGDCAPPEEICNGVDDDCDGLIDEGHDYVGRDEQRISAEGAEAVNPRILSIDGGWRVVYSVPGLGAFGGGQFVTRRDDPTSAWSVPVSAAGSGLEPDFAASEDGLMLTWTRRFTSSSGSVDRLFARPLNRDGTSSGPQVQLEADVSMPARPRVVWDGLAFRIAYHDADLQVRSVDASGSPIDAPQTVSSDRGNPADFVFRGGLYAGAWARGSEVYFSSADLSRIPTQIVIRDVEHAEHGSLDGSGTGFLVAWYEDVREDGLPQTQSLRILHLDGTTPTETDAVVTTSISGDGFVVDDVEPATVRFGGGQYLLTWADQRDDDQEIYFARVSEDGEVVQAATRLTVAPGRADSTSAAFLDDRFGVVWADERAGDPEVRFAEVACPAE